MYNYLIGFVETTFVSTSLLNFFCFKTMYWVLKVSNQIWEGLYVIKKSNLTLLAFDWTKILLIACILSEIIFIQNCLINFMLFEIRQFYLWN